VIFSADIGRFVTPEPLLYLPSRHVGINEYSGVGTYICGARSDNKGCVFEQGYLLAEVFRFPEVEKTIDIVSGHVAEQFVAGNVFAEKVVDFRCGLHCVGRQYEGSFGEMFPNSFRDFVFLHSLVTFDYNLILKSPDGRIIRSLFIQIRTLLSVFQ
jgi:hypothetical protein